jgi:hypothetical protein
MKEQSREPYISEEHRPWKPWQIALFAAARNGPQATGGVGDAQGDKNEPYDISPTSFLFQRT